MQLPLDCEKAIIICDLYIDEDGRMVYSDDVGELQQKQSRTTILATWAVSICIICTVVNCLIALQLPELAPSLLEPIFSVTREQYQILHRPVVSSDRGDETAPERVTLSKGVITYPIALIQTDLTTGRYVLNEALVSGGMLRVSQTSSIILQFEAVGPGIHQCELMLRLTPDAIPSRLSTQAYSFYISIHQVEQFPSLDITTLSQAELPARLTNIGYLAAVHGTAINWIQPFDCGLGEVLTFEVSCFKPGDSIEECDLEWWQTTRYEDSYKNILMIQRGYSI
uniref:Ubiquitin 3 binding protein But2 C-terminal domain-containing protein n=1 Tax=Psilocybe cubensis TaxID=181762 RepID=A0A8H7XWM8_PSICU